jgi:NAD(P)-dependent dehydrogenase (short-subunit alcohol dehydrogenase family)
MQLPGLKGQRVVIIGGSTGIGYAVAECALAEGATVVVGSSSAANVEAAVLKLSEGASGGVVNVRDESSVAAFFRAHGKFDHLAFTAGDFETVHDPMPISQLDMSKADEHLQVRFWGALKAVKHALPHMSANGSITLTDGTLTHRPMKGRALLSAFGGAIEHLVRGLAIDLAPIRVNSVCPGVTLTKTLTKLARGRESQMTAHQPLPRGGQPVELAQAYLYSMRGGFTTGQILIVDGGQTLV